MDSTLLSSIGKPQYLCEEVYKSTNLRQEQKFYFFGKSKKKKPQQVVNTKDGESASSSKTSVIQFEKNIFIMMVSYPITDL